MYFSFRPLRISPYWPASSPPPPHIPVALNLDNEVFNAYDNRAIELLRPRQTQVHNPVLCGCVSELHIRFLIKDTTLLGRMAVAKLTAGAATLIMLQASG